MVSVGVCLLAFLITYLSIPLLRKLAFRFGIVDLPGEERYMAK
jgi:UDP-N-acetylmuramyl pentapeptide phosphotransferase/UDP-N-acetylglucosamine-1-phosphate transferase